MSETTWQKRRPHSYITFFIYLIHTNGARLLREKTHVIAHLIYLIRILRLITPVPFRTRT